MKKKKFSGKFLKVDFQTRPEIVKKIRHVFPNIKLFRIAIIDSLL